MVLYYTFTCIQFQVCSLLRKLREKVTSGERNVQSMLNTVTSYTKEKKGVKDSHACQVPSKKETKAAKFTVPGTGRVFNNCVFSVLLDSLRQKEGEAEKGY